MKRWNLLIIKAMEYYQLIIFKLIFNEEMEFINESSDGILSINNYFN